MERLCNKCINKIFVHREHGGYRSYCIYGVEDIYSVDECSHFKPKDKESLEHKQPQIDVLNKEAKDGRTISEAEKKEVTEEHKKEVQTYNHGHHCSV